MNKSNYFNWSKNKKFICQTFPQIHWTCKAFHQNKFPFSELIMTSDPHLPQTVPF